LWFPRAYECSLEPFQGFTIRPLFPIIKGKGIQGATKGMRRFSGSLQVVPLGPPSAAPAFLSPAGTFANSHAAQARGMSDSQQRAPLGGLRPVGRLNASARPGVQSPHAGAPRITWPVSTGLRRVANRNRPAGSKNDCQRIRAHPARKRIRETFAKPKESPSEWFARRKEMWLPAVSCGWLHPDSARSCRIRRCVYRFVGFQREVRQAAVAEQWP